MTPVLIVLLYFVEYIGLCKISSISVAVDSLSLAPGHFLPYKVLGEFPHAPLYLPHQPFGNCYAPPVFCPFQLRSVTGEQHVRIMWFTRPSPLSNFAVGPHTHISSAGCFVSFDVQQYRVAQKVSHYQMIKKSY